MQTTLPFLALLGFLGALLCCRILARKTRRSEELWTLIGAFLGWIAVAYLWHQLRKQECARRTPVPHRRVA
ncbi:MAG TPA: hypothetical protein VGM39_08785 [Kofleriaceae bacterium]|jgi:hypothetical protein